MDLDNICIVKVKEVFACCSPNSPNSAVTLVLKSSAPKMLFLVCHCLEKSSSSGSVALKDIGKEARSWKFLLRHCLANSCMILKIGSGECRLSWQLVPPSQMGFRLHKHWDSNPSGLSTREVSVRDKWL